MKFQGVPTGADWDPDQFESFSHHNDLPHFGGGPASTPIHSLQYGQPVWQRAVELPGGEQILQIEGPADQRAQTGALDLSCETIDFVDAAEPGIESDIVVAQLFKKKQSKAHIGLAPLRFDYARVGAECLPIFSRRER